jgi:hypothetical protein
MSTLVEAPVTQLLDGLPLGGTAVSRHCTACGRELAVADRVRVYAYRMAESNEWDLPRLYCRGCKDDLVGTLGAVEVLADARLGSVALPKRRSHALCLVEVAVVATSGAREGSEP